MKNVIFKKIIIVDKASQKAKIQTFTKGINIVTSKNGEKGNYVGKSTLLKSLYHSLGADAKFDKSKYWEATDKYYYILDFAINDVDYTVLRHDRYFAVFDSEKRNLFSTIMRDELSEYLSELFNMKIYLKNSTPEHKYELAKPFALFCLNYLDQKSVSGCNFASFNNINEFSDIYSDVILSHLGINNSEMNSLTDLINHEKEKLKEFQKRNEILYNMIDKINSVKDVATIPDNIDTAVNQLEKHKSQYEQRIKQLNTIKEKLYELYNIRSKLVGYLNEIETVIKTKSKNDNILKNHRCPLCENNIENYTAVFFKKVRCADEAQYQLIDSSEELIEVERKINLQKAKYETLSNELEELENIICSGNSDIERSIEAIGIKKYKESLVSESNEISHSIITTDKKIKEAQEKQKLLKKRIDLLNLTYEDILVNTIEKYNISIFTLPNKVNVDSKFTCSDNHILTTLWLTALNKLKRAVNASGTFFPIVFDNPTDRDFDDENSLTVLKMIFDCKTDDDQIIVSKVSLDTSDFKEYTISNHINLINEKYSLLNKADYKLAASTLSSLCEGMF
ncbi:MAG: hypothetical protein HFE42_06595 [Clostridia bacterium]|nr:hypothetical protein [Clostridia bacterium]